MAEKRKVVVCFRGSDITKYLQQHPHAYDDLFRKADLLLPVCDYFKKRLIMLGAHPHKITVHYSAINCDQFNFEVSAHHIPADHDVRLISVCRLVAKKGIDYAIKSIAQIAQKYPNIHYTIVGDGPEKSYLKSLIKQLKLEEKVSLHGWASQQEVVALLKQSHIFLLPSRTADDGNEEGIANALKEAMAIGLISIGTWHAGTPELICDGVTGFLVPQKSVFQLSKAIEYVIQHPEQWASISVAARKKIEDDFETKKSIEKLGKIFYTLLD